MRIGVLGCGRMASAVVEGLCASDAAAELDWVTYTPSHTSGETLAAKVGGRAVRTLEDLGRTDMVIVGCKPHQFPALAEKLVVGNVPLADVVSIMAAVSIGDIRSALKARNVTRLMPSLPMLHGEGISLLCHAPSVEVATRRFLHKALGSCSRVFELESEELLDRLTLVAASGPAYVYYLARGFEELLNRWQDDAALSRDLVVRLFKGASVAMEREGKSSLEELLAQVTSEKGVTMEAIATFEKDDLKGILHDGLERAWRRMLEIRKHNF